MDQNRSSLPSLVDVDILFKSVEFLAFYIRHLERASPSPESSVCTDKGEVTYLLQTHSGVSISGIAPNCSRQEMQQSLVPVLLKHNSVI